MKTTTTKGTRAILILAQVDDRLCAWLRVNVVFFSIFLLFLFFRFDKHSNGMNTHKRQKKLKLQRPRTNEKHLRERALIAPNRSLFFIFKNNVYRFRYLSIDTHWCSAAWFGVGSMHLEVTLRCFELLYAKCLSNINDWFTTLFFCYSLLIVINICVF